MNTLTDEQIREFLLEKKKAEQRKAKRRECLQTIAYMLGFSILTFTMSLAAITLFFYIAGGVR